MDKPNKELLQAFIDWFMCEYSNFSGKPISERYDEAFDSFNNDFIDARYDAFQDGWKAQQAKVEELQRRNQMLSDSTLEMGGKHIRDTNIINQQASTLFRLREFIYGSGDLREYSDEELLEHQRILKVILAGEQALKGEG